MGILGMGEIGRAVAQAGLFFGMRVKGLVRREPAPQDKVANVTYLVGMEKLPELLSDCDYVVALLPSTPETRGLLTVDQLKSCAGRTIVINAGRGDLALTDEMWAEACDKGHLRVG